MCSTLEIAKSLNHSLIEAYANYVTNFWMAIFGTATQYSTQFQQKIQPSDGSRQWWYQTCSELAYFQNAPAVGSIRSKFVNMTYFRTHCKNVFGMVRSNTIYIDRTVLIWSTCRTCGLTLKLPMPTTVLPTSPRPTSTLLMVRKTRGR